MCWSVDLCMDLQSFKITIASNPPNLFNFNHSWLKTEVFKTKMKAEGNTLWIPGTGIYYVLNVVSACLICVKIIGLMNVEPHLFVEETIDF